MSSSSNLEIYNVLKKKNILIYDLVKWHFEKILTGINKRLTFKRKFTDPFVATLSREIHATIFMKFIEQFVTLFNHLDFLPSAKIIKKGQVTFYRIEFKHLRTFVHHFQNLTGVMQSALAEYNLK